MSAKSRDGVVDKWGRSYDIKNLFVADGSVITTGLFLTQLLQLQHLL